MYDFFNNYLNIKKIVEGKRKYKKHMARVNALPEDYRYVFKKIQEHMWMFVAGNGYGMMEIHYDLIELFESGAAEGKHVMDITGEDIAAFCDELMRNTETYTKNWRERFNRDIMSKIGNKKDR